MFGLRRIEFSRGHERLLLKTAVDENGPGTILHDFGDMWEFDVALEQVDPESKIQKPVVLEKHGIPPKQYGWRVAG